MSKSLIFLLKSFLGDFCRQFAIFFWSHWRTETLKDPLLTCVNVSAALAFLVPTTYMSAEAKIENQYKISFSRIVTDDDDVAEAPTDPISSYFWN